MVDLAIVGPGVLGSLVAEQYKSTNPVAKVVLVFRSEDTERRDRCITMMDGAFCSAVDGKCCVRLEKEGYKVTTSEEADKKNLKAKNVVFSAPPTGRRVFLQLRLVLHPQYYYTHPQETTNMQRMSPGL